MISHQTNQFKDICDVDHMLKSAPAALVAANYPMFVINPFSVIKHNSTQKYMFILLPKPRNQTILICVQFGFIKLILLFAF